MMAPMESGGSMTQEFRVLQAYGPKMRDCIEQAIIVAKCTGSTGATFQYEQGGEIHSLARVERVLEKPSHSILTVQEKG